MGTHVIKMPDIGEGIAEAELVAWHVKPGDTVAEDQVARRRDDRQGDGRDAVAGRRQGAWRSAARSARQMAVGSELIRHRGGRRGQRRRPLRPRSRARPHAARRAAPAAAAQRRLRRRAPPRRTGAAQRAGARAARPRAAAAHRTDAARATPATSRIASPAVRRRAWDLGIDLQYVHGSGPAGRITHDDLDAYAGIARPAGAGRGSGRATPSATTKKPIPVIGLRRKIAEKMQEAKRRIPHFTYVEEIDVTELEELRAQPQRRNGPAARQADAAAVPDARHGAWRCATSRRSTPASTTRPASSPATARCTSASPRRPTPGLMVPVVRHAEARDLWASAAEIARLAEAARSGKATRDELTGSTITITSLGALGGIVTTPVINHPEVAIVGVNRIVERPVIRDGAVVRAPDDEPVVVVRSPRRRRLRRRATSSRRCAATSRRRRRCSSTRVRSSRRPNSCAGPHVGARCGEACAGTHRPGAPRRLRARQSGVSQGRSWHGCC